MRRLPWRILFQQPRKPRQSKESMLPSMCFETHDYRRLFTHIDCTFIEEFWIFLHFEFKSGTLGDDPKLHSKTCCKT